MNAFLLETIRQACGRRDPAALQPPRAQVDWETFSSLVHRHGLGGLVYEQLRASEGMLPDRIMGWLQAQHDQVADRNVQLLGELAAVISRLSDRGIPVLVLKGPVLAQLGVGLLIRRFHDLDLLVRPADLDAVAGILRSLGFWEVSRGPQPYHRIFARIADGFPIVFEVHFALVSERHPSIPDIEGVWERAATIDLGTCTVSAPEFTDHLLLVVRQLPTHQWALSLFVDIARMTERWGPTIEWPVLCDRARAWRMAALTGAALYAVQVLFALSARTFAEHHLRPKNYLRRVQWQLASQALAEQFSLRPDHRIFRASKFLIVDRMADLAPLLPRRLALERHADGGTADAAGDGHRFLDGISSLIALAPAFLRAARPRRFKRA